jgi:uncharacterized membrane protein
MDLTQTITTTFSLGGLILLITGLLLAIISGYILGAYLTQSKYIKKLIHYAEDLEDKLETAQLELSEARKYVPAFEPKLP